MVFLHYFFRFRCHGAVPQDQSFPGPVSSDPVHTDFSWSYLARSPGGGLTVIYWLWHFYMWPQPLISDRTTLNRRRCGCVFVFFNVRKLYCFSFRGVFYSKSSTLYLWSVLDRIHFRRFCDNNQLQFFYTTHRFWYAYLRGSPIFFYSSAILEKCCQVWLFYFPNVLKLFWK